MVVKSSLGSIKGFMTYLGEAEASGNWKGERKGDAKKVQATVGCRRSTEKGKSEISSVL
jgi:hypothetical protein